MMKKPWMLVLGGLVLVGGLSGCGASSDSDDATGDIAFPNFSNLALEAAPNLAEASLFVGMGVKGAVNTLSQGALAFPSLTYTTDTGSWTTAISPSADLFGTVLNGNDNAPIKSMFAVINAAQGLIDQIDFDNCTAIPSTAVAVTPFFATATNDPFNDWTDTGKYTCYTTSDSGIMAFGRSAITSPSSGCTDAFEYYVLSASASDDAAVSASNVAQYGATSDGFSSGRYYYNGCTQELKLFVGYHTQYSGGYRFSGRSELTGNVEAKTFSVRIAYIDDSNVTDGSDSGTLITVLGTGKNKKTSSTDTAASFIMGYAQHSPCNLTGTCGSLVEKNFCVANDSEAASYSQVTSGASTTCGSHETAYMALTGLVFADIPSDVGTVTAASMGLE